MQQLEKKISQSEEAVVLRIPCSDRTGETTYEARLLREFDQNYSLSPQKVADLWRAAKDHKVLFSDYTDGKFVPFFIVLMDPQGVWVEICREGESVPVGVAYITRVRPFHEADGHFAFWDSIGSGREPMVLFLLEWVMDRYNLHRVNAHIPRYQSGTRRFAERTGFKLEGEKREGVMYEGERVSVMMYGILRSEVNEQISRIW